MLWNAHERDQVAETGNPYLGEPLLLYRTFEIAS